MRRAGGEVFLMRDGERVEVDGCAGVLAVTSAVFMNVLC